MKNMKSLLKKDCIEFLRTKRIAIYGGALGVLILMVLFTTFAFPRLMTLINDVAPEIFADITSLDEIVGGLVPKDLAGGFGLWSADVGMFISMVVIFFSGTILPSEIRNGRWVLPVNSGYKKNHIVLSKSLIYGIGAFVCVFVSTMVFYCIASTFMERNMTFKEALFCTFCLSFAFFAVSVYSVLLSVLFKHCAIPIIILIVGTVATPDILTFFEIGEYLPTYLYTIAYSAYADYSNMWIPLLLSVISMLLLFFAVKLKLRR